MEIHSKNVGRIAERIAMNELEARGFHIIDLAYMSKTSANVDFIASRDGESFNIQVKGASVSSASKNPNWGVHYGYCDDEIIKRKKPVFNSKLHFALKADYVILISVSSVKNYRAFVLPVSKAEEAAQLNLEAYYRQNKKDGTKRSAGKLWIHVDATKKSRISNEFRDMERSLIVSYENNWDLSRP